MRCAGCRRNRSKIIGAPQAAHPDLGACAPSRRALCEAMYRPTCPSERKRHVTRLRHGAPRRGSPRPGHGEYDAAHIEATRWRCLLAHGRTSGQLPPQHARPVKPRCQTAPGGLRAFAVPLAESKGPPSSVLGSAAGTAGVNQAKTLGVRFATIYGHRAKAHGSQHPENGHRKRWTAWWLLGRFAYQGVKLRSVW